MGKCEVCGWEEKMDFTEYSLKDGELAQMIMTGLLISQIHQLRHAIEGIKEAIAGSA